MASQLAAVSRGHGLRVTPSTAMPLRCSKTSLGETTHSKVFMLIVHQCFARCDTWNDSCHFCMPKH